MIKPDSLNTLISQCTDSKWLGDVLRALGGQQVELDFGQKQAYAMVMHDSNAMEERAEEKRRQTRERVARYRELHKNDSLATEKNGEKAESVTDVTLCNAQERTVTHPSIHPSNHPSIQPSKEKKENTKEKKREMLEQFETFWKAYPRKTGKKPSMEKFFRILRDGKVQAGEIIEAINNQVNAGMFSDDLSYIPHPLTWLNQGRWSDEVVGREGKADRGEVTKLANEFRTACRRGSDLMKSLVRKKASEAGYDWVEVENEISRLRERESK